MNKKHFKQMQDSLTSTTAALKDLQFKYDSLQEDYKRFYKFILVILDHMPDKELTVHLTQFRRLADEMRIDQTFDKMANEVTLKMLTLKD